MQREQRQGCKAVILTAIPVEFQAVRRHLRYVRKVVHKDTGMVYWRGMFLAKGGACEVGIAQIHMGNARAAVEAERAITSFAPRFAFFVGVAGGLKDVRLGDVVVARKVYNYGAGKEETTFRPRPEVEQSAYALVQRARAEANCSAWLRRLGGAIPQPPPRVLVEPIAAGESVQASTRSATYKLLRTSYSDAVAVEMEGHGFLLALHAHPQVGALVIRGISDLIDGKSEADAAHFQEIAARHASAFAFEVLAQLIGQPDSEGACLKVSEDEWEMPPLMPPSRESERFHIQQQGLNAGIVQQGHHNQSVQNFIMGEQKKDEIAEGREYLQRGQGALLHGDYASATRYLAEAARLLHEDRAPAEGARVRYLQTLAWLGGNPPFGLALPAMRRVEQLMEGATALHPTYAYLYAFALFKRDFARNRWHESRYLQEARALMQRAQETRRTSEDEEDLALLAYCQPRLTQDAEQG